MEMSQKTRDLLHRILFWFIVLHIAFWAVALIAVPSVLLYILITGG